MRQFDVEFLRDIGESSVSRFSEAKEMQFFDGGINSAALGSIISEPSSLKVMDAARLNSNFLDAIELMQKSDSRDNSVILEPIISDPEIVMEANGVNMESCDSGVNELTQLIRDNCDDSGVTGAALKPRLGIGPNPEMAITQMGKLEDEIGPGVEKQLSNVGSDQCLNCINDSEVAMGLGHDSVMKNNIFYYDPASDIELVLEVVEGVNTDFVVPRNSGFLNAKLLQVVTMDPEIDLGGISKQACMSTEDCLVDEYSVLDRVQQSHVENLLQVVNKDPEIDLGGDSKHASMSSDKFLVAENSGDGCSMQKCGLGANFACISFENNVDFRVGTEKKKMEYGLISILKRSLEAVGNGKDWDSKDENSLSLDMVVKDKIPALVNIEEKRVKGHDPLTPSCLNNLNKEVLHMELLNSDIERMNSMTGSSYLSEALDLESPWSVNKKKWQNKSSSEVSCITRSRSKSNPSN